MLVDRWVGATNIDLLFGKVFSKNKWIWNQFGRGVNVYSLRR